MLKTICIDVKSSDNETIWEIMPSLLSAADQIMFASQGHKCALRLIIISIKNKTHISYLERETFSLGTTVYTLTSMFAIDSQQ